MKRRLVWLVLFIAAIATVLIGWGWHQEQSPRSSMGAIDLSQSREVVAPSVDSQRLLADVATLAVERYTEDSRRQALRYLTDALEQAGWTPQLEPFEGGINLYAERAGTDPEAGSILLAAHYDTVEQSPGADDNATSVAVVLEAARLLGTYPTPRTLQLVLFDLEESGLLGSEAFAQKPLDTLQGAIVMDMLGYACYEAGCQSYPSVLPVTPPTDRGDFLAVIGDQGHPYLIDSFMQSGRSDSPKVLTLSVPTLGRLTPDLVRSDHVPFWRKGVGAVLVTDTANFRNPHYHQPTDTRDTIDSEFFVGSAQRIIDATTALLTQ